MKQKKNKKLTKTKNLIELIKFSLTKQTGSDKRKVLYGYDPFKK